VLLALDSGRLNIGGLQPDAKQQLAQIRQKLRMN